MELLKRLYSISSPSGNEKLMRKFIKRYIAKNVPDAIVKTDKSKNVFVTRGNADNYPCIACHIDEVRPYKGHFYTICLDGKIFGWDADEMKQVGIGGDDKNGIWIALKLLESTECMKAAFFVSEESGCVGSSECDLDFFNDCRYIVEADRRNGGDIITAGGWRTWVSEEFMSALTPISERFGYMEKDGLTTDVDMLSSRGVGISCINISCGYYNPHTTSDYTVIAELKNALEFARAIFAEMTDTYPHIQECGLTYNWCDDYDHDISWERTIDLRNCEWDMTDQMQDKGEEFDLEVFYEDYKDYYPSLNKTDFEKIHKDSQKYFGESDYI